MIRIVRERRGWRRHAARSAQWTGLTVEKNRTLQGRASVNAGVRERRDAPNAPMATIRCPARSPKRWGTGAAAAYPPRGMAMPNDHPSGTNRTGAMRLRPDWNWRGHRPIARHRCWCKSRCRGQRHWMRAGRFAQCPAPGCSKQRSTTPTTPTGGAWRGPWRVSWAVIVCNRIADPSGRCRSAIAYTLDG